MRALPALLGAALVLCPLRLPALHPLVEDQTKLLRADEVAAIQSLDRPFAARVFFTSSYATLSQLDGFVRGQMTAPDLVVVAIDPLARNTVAHFSRDMGIDPSAHQLITERGDPYFQRSDWSGGVSAILAIRASDLLSPIGTELAPSPQGPPTFVVILLGASLALLLVLVLFGLRQAHRGTRPQGGSADVTPRYPDSGDAGGGDSHHGGGFDGGGGGSHW